MRISAAGIDHIKEYEGYRAYAYQDGGGVWTQGYGTTGPRVVPGTLIDVETAERWLRDDVTEFENAVTMLVRVPLTQNQFDALVIFVYNIGAKQFSTSTMLKLLNVQDYEGAAKQFPRWNKDNGQVIAGLTDRREKEQALFVG